VKVIIALASALLTTSRRPLFPSTKGEGLVYRNRVSLFPPRLFTSLWTQISENQTTWCYLLVSEAVFLSVWGVLSSPGSRLNTSSLLCDCQLKWLPVWVAEQTFMPGLNASCAHPQMLKGSSVFAVSQEEFVCGK